MTEVVERLVADMRWRMSPAGGKYTPSGREAASWGAFQINWPTKLMGGCGLMILALGGMGATIHVVEAIGVMLMFVMFMGVPISFWASGFIQRSLNLKAYQKQLESNERFSLVEYSRLMTRHIEMAQRDPALGGPKEVERLTALRARIIALLESGAGLDGRQQHSTLGDEAELAESVLESYNIGPDELAQLDARLPEELRSKLADVDREARNRPQQQAD